VRETCLETVAIGCWPVLLVIPFLSLLSESGKPMKVKYRVLSFETVCRMAAAGLGVTLGPAGMVSLSSAHDLAEIELDEPWALRRPAIACRRYEELSAPARVLLEHLMPSA
jgi:DNA-binding transcriptional LysR family regulator